MSANRQTDSQGLGKRKKIASCAEFVAEIVKFPNFIARIKTNFILCAGKKKPILAHLEITGN
jgi:hypothetical protein